MLSSKCDPDCLGCAKLNTLLPPCIRKPWRAFTAWTEGGGRDGIAAPLIVERILVGPTAFWQDSSGILAGARSRTNLHRSRRGNGDKVTSACAIRPGRCGRSRSRRQCQATYCAEPRLQSFSWRWWLVLGLQHRRGTRQQPMVRRGVGTKHGAHGGPVISCCGKPLAVTTASNTTATWSDNVDSADVIRCVWWQA